MIYPLVRELAADGMPVAVTWRVPGVSRSGFYDWSTHPPSTRALADTALTVTITEIHAGSRRSYGASPAASMDRRRSRPSTEPDPTSS